MNKITLRTYLYENFRFFKTNLDSKNLPMTLANFEALQKKTFLQEKQTLHMQWREYLISEIQDTLRDIYRFYQVIYPLKIKNYSIFCFLDRKQAVL